MQSTAISRFLIALAIGLFLSACVARNQAPVAALNDDDDAVCQANGVKVGSPEYVACRKDRDAQRNLAIARADRRQRNLGEYMLNNPSRP